MRAMPSARAGRASPRAGSRLGHSATIAIAALSLVGCRFASGYDPVGCRFASGYHPNAWKRDEIPPHSYSDVASGAARDPVMRDMVRGFMADGKIDYGELEQINDYDTSKANDAVPLARLKGDLASGIETEGHDRETGHGAEHESPTLEEGDAQ